MVMKKELTQEELEEQELASKINKVIFELDLKRGNGVTLEKNQYIGECQSELEAELSKIKTKKVN